MEQQIYSVTQINTYIQSMMDSDRLLSGLCIRGEISNYKVYPSGHHYFSLKDATGALRCVMFKSSAIRLRFRPENGMKVLALGKISVFPRDGAYQLYCTNLTPDGVGDLHVAFEQLKAKLQAEGLFDPSHKKPLPRYPGTIAIITSSAGAAVHDMLRILRKRYPLTKVLLLPVRVQGVEFEVFASRSGLVYENVKKHDNDHDLDGRANEARDGRDACAGSQCAHGCHVGHLRAARHCQGERVRAGAQNAQDEALGNVTVRKNGKRDGIHEHNENAGVYAAHAQHYSYHQKNRYGNNVFPGVARAGFEQGRHDGLGNGIGCSAHGVDLRLYVAEQQNEEKAADGDKHAVNECTCQGVDKRQPVEKHDNGRAYYGCYIDRPVFIAEYDYYQKAEQASDYTHK